MRRNVARLLGWVTFVIAAVVLLILNIGLVWVATGPRNLAKTLPYIEEALSAEAEGYTVKVGDGMLLWDGWRHPIDIRLHKLDVITQGGVRFATFPDVSLGLDIWSLLFGEVVPTSLRVRAPVISLFQTESGAISFGFPQPPPERTVESSEAPPEEQGAMLAAAMEGFIVGKSGPLAKLHTIEITGADVSVGNAKKGVLAHASNVAFSLKRGWRGLSMKLDADIPQAGANPAHIQGELQGQGAGAGLEGRIRLQRFWAKTLLPLLPPELRGVVDIAMPLNGWVDLTLGPQGEWQDARFTLNATKGEMRADWLEFPLQLDQLQMEGRARPGTYALDKLMIDFGGPVVTGKGQINGEGEAQALQFEGQMRGADVSYVRKFWPPKLAPMSRDWVLENVTAAAIPRASIVLTPKLSDFNLPTLPEKTVDATMDFDHATLRFLPNHAPLTEAQGTLHVTGKTLTADVKKASFLKDTRMGEGHVFIEDLNVDNPRIDVRFEADAAASDIAQFMTLPPADHAANLKLDPARIQGRAIGGAKIGFYFFTPKDARGRPREDMGVTYDIAADLSQVSQAGVLGKFDLENVNGRAAIDNKGLNLKGKGIVNGVPSDATVRYLFSAEQGMNTFVDVTARAPAAALKRFGYPEFPFLSGTLGVNASLKQGPGAEKTEASFDLRDAALVWNDMRWSKPLGQPAKLTLTAEKAGEQTNITQFDFKAADTEAKGSAQLAAGMGDVRSISLSRLRLGENDLSKFDYETLPGGFKIHARGASADATPWMQGHDDFSFKRFPAVDVDVDLGRLILGEKRELAAVKGRMRCSTETCSSADLTGKTGDKPFRFTIAPGGPGRTLDITSEDAGEILRVLDVYGSMHEGNLHITGAYDDSKPTHPLTGTLMLKDYRITEAPVMAKLLTLASLTGLVDLLQGNGVSFDKCNGEYTLENDVITLKDVKAYGGSIGISTEGTVRMPGSVMDLKGTVVPAYAINSILKNVPLIGEALTGGGEGVFGARYSLSGPYDNVDVSVNPLSILTPGFLRGIFDIFDKPAEGAAKAPPVEGEQENETKH